MTGTFHIALAMKPLDGNFAQNALKHGVAGLNIDGCRIGTDGRPHIERRNDKTLDGDIYGSGMNGSRSLGTTTTGRWPANVILDSSERVAKGFPSSVGRVDNRTSCESGGSAIWGDGGNKTVTSRPPDNGGSTSRFFKQVKT